MNSARIFLIAVCSFSFLYQPVRPIQAGSDIFSKNARLGTGINLGNMLEAREGGFRITLQDHYFELISEAGFDSIRLPVNFARHAKDEPPYTICEEFFRKVDSALNNALSYDLAVIIDMHNYRGIMENPKDHEGRFIELWRQIADRYRLASESVYFELLNEPHSELNSERLNALIPRALDVIRRKHPERPVIVGTADWNGFWTLDQLELPADDDNIIVTFHYYSPFEFTHQGAEWVSDPAAAEDWVGTEWKGTDEEKNRIKAHFDQVADWSKNNERPVYLGEYGVYNKADMDSRVRWTRFVSDQAKERGFSLGYWEFCAGFGVYDRHEETWRARLLDALFPGE